MKNNKLPLVDITKSSRAKLNNIIKRDCKTDTTLVKKIDQKQSLSSVLRSEQPFRHVDDIDKGDTIISPYHPVIQHYIIMCRLRTTRIRSILQTFSAYLTQMIHVLDLDKTGFCRTPSGRTYIMAKPIYHGSSLGSDNPICDNRNLISYSCAPSNISRGRPRKISLPPQVMRFEDIHQSFKDKMNAIALACVNNIESKQHRHTYSFRTQLLLDNLYDHTQTQMNHFISIFDSLISQLSTIQNRLDFFTSIINIVESFILNPHHAGYDVATKCQDLIHSHAFFPDCLTWTNYTQANFDCKSSIEMMIKLTTGLIQLEQIICISKMTPFVNLITTTTTIFQMCAMKYHEQITKDNIYHCADCGYDLCAICGYYIPTSASLCQRCEHTNRRKHLRIYRDNMVDQIIWLNTSMSETKTPNTNHSIHSELYSIVEDMDTIWRKSF